ncbi:hypothetical protein HYW67_04530 [Candidatus Parcubacteria bacterium]|nr:hypothetical protein [Candidatus Parcubacteria bacterium]
MVATTDQKARLLDLTTGMLEMVRDGNRDIEQVSAVLQVIKEDPKFVVRLLAPLAPTEIGPREVVFREMEECVISIPALPRPTLKELRKKFSWVKERGGIERDTSPTEAVTLRLGTVLRPDENHIGGPEYERRIASLTDLFGYQQLEWLVDHQNESPAFKALLGQIYIIDGPGLVAVAEDGGRHSPCLSGDGRRWKFHWSLIARGLDQFGRLAVSGK